MDTIISSRLNTKLLMELFNKMNDNKFDYIIFDNIIINDIEVDIKDRLNIRKFFYLEEENVIEDCTIEFINNNKYYTEKVHISLHEIKNLLVEYFKKYEKLEVMSIEFNMKLIESPFLVGGNKEALSKYFKIELSRSGE